MSKKYYIVYRVFSRKERPWFSDTSRIYGWTNNKQVLKAFMQQRDSKKYVSYEMDKEEIGEIFSSTHLPIESMIDMTSSLKSSSTGETIAFFSTANEFTEAQKRIHRIFIDLSSLSNIESKKKDTEYFVKMFLGLKEKYIEALHYIGYRPKEIDILFDSVEDQMSKVEVIHRLDTAYESFGPREWDYVHGDMQLGYSVLEDVSEKIIYSLESFVKALREDL